MFMKVKVRKGCRASTAGFSLIELLIVIVIVLIALSVALLNFPTALAASRMNSGVEITLSQLRLARQEAIARRMNYTVTFAPPGTITTVRLIQGQPPFQERSITLPPEIQFLAPPGLPNPGPDGFGTGRNAIDFDQGNGGGGTVILFVPDGTAQGGNGGPDDGVVYIAHSRALAPPHAISMWGATGRFKTWELSTGGGARQWY